jgi:hypothetical protein
MFSMLALYHRNGQGFGEEGEKRLVVVDGKDGATRPLPYP